LAIVKTGKTAKSFDLHAARNRLVQAEEASRTRDRQRCKRASLDASKIIERIIEIARPKRIYQWGSLLSPEQFREYSDIDIALEGVRDPELFFKVLKEAEALTQFPVDIVQLETIEPEYASDIRTRGKLVYEHE
jgi:predicted nucleotidyltransferase